MVKSSAQAESIFCADGISPKKYLKRNEDDILSDLNQLLMILRNRSYTTVKLKKY